MRSVVYPTRIITIDYDVKICIQYLETDIMPNIVHSKNPSTVCASVTYLFLRALCRLLYLCAPVTVFSGLKQYALSASQLRRVMEFAHKPISALVCQFYRNYSQSRDKTMKVQALLTTFKLSIVCKCHVLFPAYVCLQ